MLPRIRLYIKASYSLPWKQKHVRADVKKAFTVQIPEEYVLKLQYIKEQTNQSQQKILQDYM